MLTPEERDALQGVVGWSGYEVTPDSALAAEVARIKAAATERGRAEVRDAVLEWAEDEGFPWEASDNARAATAGLRAAVESTDDDSTQPEVSDRVFHPEA